MKKTKIGILTLSASDNCGSLLQTYALQHVLEKDYDCYVEIVNLITKESADIYHIIPSNFYKHPKKTLFTFEHIYSVIHQRRDYQEFRDKYLNMTSKVYRNVDDLKSIKNNYDIIIAGSDQIWNVYMADYNDAYFIPWETNAKKISYAASLGTTQIIDSHKKDMIAKWLQDFKQISVREQTGKETISELTSHNVEILADPTMLLDYKEWKIMAGNRAVQEKYIFYYYSWSYTDDDMNKLVQKFAKKENLKVYVINSSKWYKYRPEIFNFKLYEKSGPIAFLNLMCYAQYVFIQSFHGIVFSNLLKKRLFFLNEKDKSIDCRAENLL